MWSSQTLERGGVRGGKRGRTVMFGDGGNGGQKGGKLLARIGRAATFRAGGGEERGA